jgi:tetratricopeptide (TPR) repeat protein
MRKYDEALCKLQKAIQFSPEYANAYINIGNIFYEKAKL